MRSSSVSERKQSQPQGYGDESASTTVGCTLVPRLHADRGRLGRAVVLAQAAADAVLLDDAQLAVRHVEDERARTRAVLDADGARLAVMREAGGEIELRLAHPDVVVR